MDIYQVIKYEGDNTTFIWKHPCEDFNTGSQLIVHESQEAIFFLNGQALDLFGAGRYTLTTENIPLLNKVINIPTNGESAFHCEVYFINKTEQMAIKWGTDSKVQFMEPTYHFPLSIGAHGEMSLTVADSRKLLVNVVGTENRLNQQQIVNYFRSFLMTKIKSYLAQVFKDQSINIFEVDAHLESFSKIIKDKLIPDFLEYGVILKQFFVTGISRPEDDAIYERFKNLYFRQSADVAEAELQKKLGIIEQEANAQRMIIEAQGLAKKRETEGYTYQQERGFDVAEKAASNEGVGNFSSAGIGLGMMAGVGGVVGGQVGGIVNQSMNAMTPTTSNATTSYCEQCGAAIPPGSAFCEGCGNPVQQHASNTCSNCGYRFTNPNGRFCPKCGTPRNNY